MRLLRRHAVTTHGCVEEGSSYKRANAHELKSARMHRKKVRVSQDLHQRKKNGPGDSFKGFQQEPGEPFWLKIKMIQKLGGHRTLQDRGGCIKWYQSTDWLFL
jgi:hypothetical protein